MNVRPRLTYANVASTLALMMAMSTGGAYAASLIQTSQIADGAVTTPKLRDAAVKPNKIATDAVRRSSLADGAVGSAEIANSSITGADIGAGTITAQDLQIWARRPPAYARVHWDGSQVTGSGITTEMITRPTMMVDQEEVPATGVYCFHDLPFAPAGVSATGSLNFSGPSIATVTHGQPSPCPAGTQLMVKLYMIQNSNWVAVDGTFNLVLWP